MARSWQLSVCTVWRMPDEVDREGLLQCDVGKGWGLYHELGHNLQNWDWIFEGAQENSVNLFTIYVYEHLRHRSSILACRHSGRNGSDYDFRKTDFAGGKAVMIGARHVYVGFIPAAGVGMRTSICRLSRAAQNQRLTGLTPKPINGWCGSRGRSSATSRRSSRPGASVSDAARHICGGCYRCGR